MGKLFEKTHIKNVQLKNRCVRSATFENMYSKGDFSKLVKLYETLSQNEVGLLITGNFAVCSSGRAGDIYDLEDSKVIKELPKLSEVCHKNDTKILMQLSHVGRQAFAKDLKEGPPLAPSTVFDAAFAVMPRAMKTEDIEHVKNKFIEGACKAYEAGFDGIQIHGAHGYLISQFLSPHINRRSDEYGGSTLKRCKLAIDIAKGIREKVSEDFLISIKINCHDLYIDGIDRDEFLNICSVFNNVFDAIEISSGTIETSVNFYKYFKDEPSFYRLSSRAAKGVYKGTVILVGNNRNLSVNKEILNNKDADLISVSRGLICEPKLFSRWKAGKTEDAKCSNCGVCLVKVYNNELKCYGGNVIYAADEMPEFLLGWMQQAVMSFVPLSQDVGQVDVLSFRHFF